MLSILFALFLFYVAYRLIRVFSIGSFHHRQHNDNSLVISILTVVGGVTTLLIFGLKYFIIFVIATIIYRLMQR